MADNVIRHAFQAMRTDLQGGGEPPDNRDMNARIAKLETLAEKTGERLSAIETRLTRIEVKLDQHATKEDVATLRGEMRAAVAESRNSVIMWVVSAVLLAQVLPALLKKFGL